MKSTKNTGKMLEIFKRASEWMAVLGVVAFVVAGAGCASDPAAPPQGDPLARQELFKSISKGRELPAHSDSAAAPAAPARVSGELVTVRGYVGEASGLLSQVARSRGVKFRILGPQPHLPLFVAVDVAGVSIEDFLSIVGHQFGERAKLAITDTAIEIRYSGKP